jgi:hypothetical protein
MALKAQADFEREVQGLFFSSNNMDIWHQIKQREAEMNAEDKAEAEKEKLAEIQRQREMREFRDIGVAVAIAAVLLGGVGWLLVQIIS